MKKAGNKSNSKKVLNIIKTYKNIAAKDFYIFLKLSSDETEKIG